MNAPARDPQQRLANLRLAWILASVALLFALGFVVKIWLASH
ncbi:MAG: cytochrome oxidase small assembly protein [Burkholderiaceae bacterium]